MTPAELRRKAAELRDKALRLAQQAAGENRELTEDERALIVQMVGDPDADSFPDNGERGRLLKQAELLEKLEKPVAGAQAGAGQRQTAAVEIGDQLEPGEQAEDRKACFGEFLADVLTVQDRNSDRDSHEEALQRLRNKYRSRYNDYRGKKDREGRALTATTGASGGWLIPTGFQTEIKRYAAPIAIVRPRATIVPMNGALEVPIPQLDASTVPTDGSAHFGGIALRWGGETEQKPATEPVFKQAKLSAHELSGYCPVSRVLLQLSPYAVDTLLFRMFGEASAREEDRAFFRGNRATRPNGIHFSPCLVTTSARGSASAISFANATAVWTRIPPENRGSAVWVASQAAESAVLAMTGTANSVFFPTGVYMGGAEQANAGPASVMLYMRPVLISSLLPALNTAGDFGCYDFSQYLVGDPGIMEIATSEHYLFRDNQVAFRLVNYVAGMPWPVSALTLDDGSTTVSPFVVLGTQ